jgi:hypothetical protein
MPSIFVATRHDAFVEALKAFEAAARPYRNP